jgi:hypothetical protein
MTSMFYIDCQTTVNSSSLKELFTNNSCNWYASNIPGAPAKTPCSPESFRMLLRSF